MKKRMVSKFLYEDLTYKVRGAMFKVHKVLGSGHKEIVYQKALAKEFELRNIPFKVEVSLDVVYEGVKVGNYRPDFVVDDKVLIELKALPILPIQAERQLSYYLRGTSYKLGLLANFGAQSLVVRRKIWDMDQYNQLKSV